MKDFGQEQPLILAIDAQQDLLDRIAALLAEGKFACRCCTTGVEAITAAREATPDLILCDVHLQGESGVETCQRIKQLPGREDVPVMFLSGAQLPDVIRRSHEAGGTYCLRKPFDSRVLMELIDQALGVPQGCRAVDSPGVDARILV